MQVVDKAASLAAAKAAAWECAAVAADASVLVVPVASEVVEAAWDVLQVCKAADKKAWAVAPLLVKVQVA